MKRIMTLLFTADLALGIAVGSQVTGIRAKGLWEFTWGLSTPSSEKHTGQDTFGARQCLRIQTDVAAPESLKGMTFFEISG